MKLEDAWLTLLDMDTSVIRTPSQIYSILSDLGVFKDYPKIRLAVNSALQNGLWELVSSNSVSQTDIDKLKSGLEYDGFSDVIINEIINSFYTSPKSGSNNSQQPAPSQTQNNANSKPSSLTFLGIPLGCKLEEFMAKLPKDYRMEIYDSKLNITETDIKTWLFDFKDSKERGVEMLKHVSRVGYYGNFAGLTDWYIYIHYCPFSKIVYKVEVHDSGHKGDTVFDTLCCAYTDKYGTPTKIYANLSCYYQFSVSNFEIIKLSQPDRIHYMTIKYLNSKLDDSVDAKIKQKQEELASEMQNKIIGGI